MNTAAATKAKSQDFIELILGNSNKSFSGVTSTMLQVIPYQQEQMNLVVLGKSNLPESIPSVTFFNLVRLLKRQKKQCLPCVFHARRNNEMIQALLLKHVFRLNLKVIFTSTAQRRKTWLTRFLMNNMDGLLSTCTAAACFMHIAPDELIPHGINFDEFKICSNKQELLKELGIENKRGVGIFGRVRKQKGIDSFVKMAFALAPMIPDVNFVIVGEIKKDQESFVNDLMIEIKKHGLEQRIIFTGKLPFSQVKKHIRAMSVNCAFSRNEGFGLTVIESMASGTAVVASKAGAWPDIIDDGHDGLLVDVGDTSQMIEKVKLLLQDDQLLASVIKDAGIKVRAKYSAPLEANTLIAYYRKVQTSQSRGQSC